MAILFSFLLVLWFDENALETWKTTLTFLKISLLCLLKLLSKEKIHCNETHTFNVKIF